MATPASRELRWLRAYLVFSSIALGAMALAAFRAPPERVRFEEIEVERITLVEQDGTRRLVIANRAKSPGALINGRQISPDGQRPGLIFYNDEGDEVGGLIFGGRRDSTGYWNSVSMTFDQFEQDQVMALQHIDENGRRYQGMSIFDRPDVPLDWVVEESRRISELPQGPGRDSAQRAWESAQGGHAYGVPRMFIGRDRGKASALRMFDRDGRVRLRIVVDSLGVPGIELLDATGAVTRRISGSD